MPEVSIIINCFNEARFLRETLDSVVAQTFQDWEIVFWDNASTDGSSEIAASYDQRVRRFRSETMLPLGRARSLAYEQTRGKYVAILDADDIWLPHKLERQVALFQADSRLGMTYCDSMNFDDGGDRYRVFQVTKPHRGHIFGHLLTANFIASSAVMFRRESLERLGCVFDERYTRAPDFDLMLRAAYHYPVGYVDGPLCRWRITDVDEKAWKRHLVPRVVEIKQVIDRLVEMYPDIETRYGTELQLFRARLDYNFGITAWRSDDRPAARRYLSRHLLSKKFAFVYLCTFLMSYNSFSKLKNIYRNRVTGH